MSENRITIGIKAPRGDKSEALVRVGNYSYYGRDEVGLGYISHVYLGRNDQTGELVAIKVIDFGKEDQLGQRLILEELAILEQVRRHRPQHLLLLHQHFRSNGMLYIVTEFCEGKDIAKALRKKKRFGEAEAQSVMKQLMQAYRQVYAMGIIHRDLKLANVLVQQGSLKLADFGFSIKAEKFLTQKSDYNVGSPYYMPPETLKSNKYSFLSDVWALGVMAFEMVYGKLPWREKIQSVLYEKILTTNLEELFDPAVPISEHYKQFIRGCLQIPIERRASPQFVIHYSWPLACDYLEGVQSQPGSRPLSMLRQFGTFTTRQIASHHHIPDPSHSQQNSFSKNQPLRQKSPNFLNKAEKQRSGLQLSSELQGEKVTLIGKTEAEGIASVIVSQINYCRFVVNLQELAGPGGEINKYLNSVKYGCLRELCKVKNGFPSKFSQLPHFQLYKQTQQWQKLKHIISEFTQQHPMTSNQEQAQTSSNQQLLRKIMGQLKLNIQFNFVLLQELTYLYQLKQLQSKVNLSTFAVQSKIHLLVKRRREKKPQTQPQLCARLKQRLNLLDL